MTNEELMNTVQVVVNLMDLMGQGQMPLTEHAVEKRMTAQASTTSKKATEKKASTTSKKADPISYDVKENIAVIAESGKYRMKLTLMSWNKGEYKYDLRTWVTKDNGKDEPVGKGVRMTKDQLKQLGEVIAKIS